MIGPRISDDETFWEYEGDKPTSRYITGTLYPKQTKLDPNDFLKNTAEGESDEDEEVEQTSSFTTATGTYPSSLGITCSILKQTEEIDVEINFAKYDKQERPVKPKRKSKEKNEESETDEEKKIEQGWKRRSVTVPFTIKLEKLTGINDISDEDARVVYKIKESTDNKYSVTVFLLNTLSSPPGDHYTTSNECIFQPEIKLTASKNSKTSNTKNIFQAFSANPDSFTNETPEEKTFELLFRDKKFFAAGHNCSVEWSTENKLSNSAEWVETTFIPQHEIQQIEPRKIRSEEYVKADGTTVPLSRSLLLKTLKDVKEFSDYDELLSPIVSEYDQWIKNLDQQLPSIPKKFTDNKVTDHQINNCVEAKKRISDGIKIISTNPMAGQAFQFANEVMYDQMIYSKWAKKNIKNGKVDGDAPPISEYEKDGYPSWYVFQLAYILLNIKSIVEPTSEEGKKEREIVDLLWFPTGGGKTEAYLGIVAFVLAMRRLREEEPNKYGVNVIMRYTYRLLTQQQFQRAAALMCACERKRQKNPKKWGTEPFLVGLFVGDTTTPNSNTVAEKNIKIYTKHYPKGKPASQNPVQIINCPRCGKALTPHNYRRSKYPDRIRIKCANINCFFGNPDKDESFLPVVFTDDDIVSALPSLLIGTVDKFARLSWEPRFAGIFGIVKQSCQQHGFIPGNTPTDKICRHPQAEKRRYKEISSIPPPELIIQDELHLISGTLGTLTGLYETLIDNLCLHNGIRAKIIASTATIKNSNDQIKWLFARNKSKIFPPQAFDFGESYFSLATKKRGKIHLGICATTTGGFTVDARVAAAVLRKVRHILENKQKFGYTTEEIDPYYTLVSYYNTRRNHDSATRYYEDTVPKEMGTIRKKFELGSKNRHRDLLKQELTARLDSGDIPKVFWDLDIPLSDDSCQCGGKSEKESEAELCETCKKPLQSTLDALLCTNMLSVGVDVQRLSLMIINGQPKLTSEYIQASGRIGRSQDSPGLVVTNYSYRTARDLSVFENFIDFHSKYHKNVEPGTLTPFASRARDTGLFGMLVAFARMHADKQNNCITLVEDPSKFAKKNSSLTNLLNEIKKELELRVDIVDPKERIDTIKDFEKKIEIWYSLAEKGDILRYKRNYFPNAPKPKENIIFLLKKIGDLDPPGYVGQLIPESLRQAEGNIRMYYKLSEELTENE